MHADHGVKLFCLCSVSAYYKSYDSFSTKKIRNFKESVLETCKWAENPRIHKWKCICLTFTLITRTFLHLFFACGCTRPELYADFKSNGTSLKKMQPSKFSHFSQQIYVDEKNSAKFNIHFQIL